MNYRRIRTDGLTPDGLRSFVDREPMSTIDRLEVLVGARQLGAEAMGCDALSDFVYGLDDAMFVVLTTAVQQRREREELANGQPVRPVVAAAIVAEVQVPVAGWNTPHGYGP